MERQCGHDFVNGLRKRIPMNGNVILETRHNSLDQGSFCTLAVLACIRHVLRVDDNEQETTRVSHQVAEASATAAGEAPRNGSRRLRSSSGAISIIVITHASFTLAHGSVANFPTNSRVSFIGQAYNISHAYLLDLPRFCLPIYTG